MKLDYKLLQKQYQKLVEVISEMPNQKDAELLEGLLELIDTILLEQTDHE